MPRRKWSRRLAQAGLLLGSLVAGALAAEVILRVRGVTYSLVAPHPDPDLNYTLKPGLRAKIGGVDHAYNSRGLRDREYEERAAPGVVRILCLGDSITFAQNDPLEATYPKRLESLLNARGGSTFEVLNAGVSGYNACQEAAFLREIGAAYHPRTILWQFCLNDVDSPWIPYGEGNRGILPLSTTWKRELRDHVRLWDFARAESYGLLHLLGVMEDDASNEAYARHVYSLYAESERPLRDRAWACIGRAREEAAREGSEVLLVIFPLAMQAAGELGWTDAPQREIEERCHASDLRCLDLLPPFRSGGGWDLYAKPDFIHLSPKGHESAAAVIEKAVAGLLLDRSGASAAAERP